MQALSEALAILAPMIAFAGFVSLVIERTLNLILRPLLAAIPALDPYKDYISIVFGVAIGFLFGIDLLSPLAEMMGFSVAVSWGGVVLTGILMGGGSNLIHDIWPSK